MLMNMHWCTMFREHSFNLCWNVIMLFGCPCIHLHIILNFFRLVRQRRRWWWYRCLHSPGPHLLHAMTSAVPRQAEGSNPSSKALVNGDITFVTQNGWHWRTQPTLTYSVVFAGVHYVFDTTFSRTFSLLESQREFVERFQRKEQDNKSLPMMTSACPGIPKEALCVFLIYVSSLLVWPNL